MKTEELLQNEELLRQCEKEVGKRIEQGQKVKAAKLEVAKDLGLEFDEDAAQAEKVGKLELSDEELEHVNGGIGWCWSDYACITIYNHDDNTAPVNGCARDHGNVCGWDYECMLVANCDMDGMNDAEIEVF